MQWLSNPQVRRQAHALKWTSDVEDELPLWVADLDCEAPPIVKTLLHQAADHGVFGYGSEPPAFRDAWVTHLRTAYHWDIDPDWMVPIPGVVPAMTYGLDCFPDRQRVLSPSPAYPYFATVPERTRRLLERYPLTHTPAGFIPDPTALAGRLDPSHGPSILMLCNPHNPGGAVYSKQSLRDIITLAIDTDTPLISDEIWADLRLDPVPHCPLGQLVPETHPSLTIMAATKTFNIAGFPAAIAIVPHAPTRERLLATQVAMPHISPLAFAITTGCLQEGWGWHRTLLDALRSHRARVQEWATGHPTIRVTTGHATFLAWIESPLTEAEWTRRLTDAKLRLSMGRPFGDATAVRLNYGTSPTILEAALNRLSSVLIDKDRS